MDGLALSDIPLQTVRLLALASLPSPPGPHVMLDPSAAAPAQSSAAKKMISADHFIDDDLQ